MSAHQVKKRRPWRTSFEASQATRSSSRATSVAASLSTPRQQRPGSVTSITGHRRVSAEPGSIQQTPAPLEQQSIDGPHPSRSVSQGLRDEYIPEADSDLQDRESDDWIHEVVMAIDMRNRDTIGCCYYVAAEEKLYLLNDVLSGVLDVFATLKDTLEPTTILLSARIDDKVDDLLDPDGSHGESDSVDDRLRLPYNIEVVKGRDFDYEDGKSRLCQLEIPYDTVEFMSFAAPGDDDPFENYNAGLDPGFSASAGNMLRLSTAIDFDSRLSIGCASAVLNYLQSRRSQMMLPANDRMNSLLRVSSMEMCSLNDVMYLNADTLASLQITASESHPHAQNQGPNNTGSKESLTVYGLFHHLACSPQGKQRLRAMFLRPSLNLHLIAERHRAVGTFLRTDNAAAVNVIVKSLRSIRNMRASMVHLRKGVSGSADRSQAFKSSVWTTIRAFAYHTLGIQEAAAQIESQEQLNIIIKILETFQLQKLALVGRDIETVVDFRLSQEESRTVIKEGVDEDLDATKRTYAGIEHLLSRVSEEVIEDYDGDSEGAVLNVVTYPQIGFLISVHKDQISGKFPSPPIPRPGRPVWERIFTSEHSTYYKDTRMRELDQTFGDILGNIHDREIELAFELGQRILEHEAMFCQVSDVCGELDALLALAQGAKAYNLRQPEMVEENLIDVVGGRHLLQEQLSSRFIANDTFIVGGKGHQQSFASASLEISNDRTTSTGGQSSDGSRAGDGSNWSDETAHNEPKILILTGANFSGKSVYLKQVALIVYLAHVGSFVPAQKATIGITDKIMTRVSTRETVSRQHSAFMIDLQQISSAISLCTPKSLLLIDEFGKGTEAADGAGLACAVFEHFLAMGQLQPKIIAATHFHEIFENNFLIDQPNLSFFHMEVSVDRTVCPDRQVTFLYDLKAGRSVASFGTVCAAMNGIAPRIVERALQIVQLQARGDLLASHTGLSERDKLNLAQAEELGNHFLMQDFGTTHGVPSTDPRKFLADLNFEWDSASVKT